MSVRHDPVLNGRPLAIGVRVLVNTVEQAAVVET
jgi:hypothetical protein